MTTNSTITPELLDQLLANYEKPEDLTGDDGLFKQLKRALIERALGAELTEHLGYEKGDPTGRGKGNSRNGTSSKTLLTEDGEVEIAVPRDRAGSFEPQLIPKGQTRFDGFDDKILSLYARGLEAANIKLDSVISDIIGTSGRAMIEALIAGESNPAKLAALADRRIKAAPATLAEALRGRLTKHHRFLLRLHLEQIDALDRAIAEIDTEVEANLDPFRPLIPVLTSIPGIGELAARVLLAEIGIDMSRFPTAGHLISWAGPCPKNDESAGKRRSNRMRKGAPWLKTTLIQCAWAGARKKGSYLQAQFHRLRARRGAKKAIGAVAASMLTAAYHMIANGTFYQDLGADHFERRAKPTQIKRLVAKLQNLG